MHKNVARIPKIATAVTKGPTSSSSDGSGVVERVLGVMEELL